MADLIALARQVFAVHGILPVPVAGKTPLGGAGWNTFTFDDRLIVAQASMLSGIGLQCGLVFHPIYGPCTVAVADCDEDDKQKQTVWALTFLHLIGHEAATKIVWRWGRRPACVIFIRGQITREKYGSIQLLGPGKQAVWWGAHPDAGQYTHPDGDLLGHCPPLIDAAIVERAIRGACDAAGISYVATVVDVDKLANLTEADIASLTADNLLGFRNELNSILSDIATQPDGTGGGERLYQLGLRYGAVIKASGRAPTLCDAARQITPDAKFIDYNTVDNPLLVELGVAAEYAFGMLPGGLAAGRQRNFARGVGMSKGLGQQGTVERAKQAGEVWNAVKPKGRSAPGEDIQDLMARDLPPLRFRAGRYFTDSGTYLVIGKPKIGKGYIVLDFALGVSEGGEFWGERCEKSGVLLYMMEDGPRRLRDRVKQLRPNGLAAGHARIKFRYAKDGPFTVNHDGTGSLLDDIRKHVHDYPDLKTVVVDVLQKVRGTREKGVDAYNADYPMIGSLQSLSHELGVLIVVVHHMKKGKVDDVGDSASGSLAITGAVDGSLFIWREDNGLKVKSELRDIEEYELTLKREEGDPVWKPTDTESPVNKNTQASKIALALHTAACELTAADLTRRTGLGIAIVNAVLHRMLNSGQVTRQHRGFYMIAGLPHRDRTEGVKDVLKRCKLEAVTEETERKYALNGAPEGSTFVVRTDEVLNELEAAGFDTPKKALDALKHRGLCVYNSDSVWLIGLEWTGQTLPQQQANPFAFKFPWG